MAAFVEKESGIKVDLDASGRIGEFTVWVDGELVEKKGQLELPDKNRILAAITEKLPRVDPA